MSTSEPAPSKAIPDALAPASGAWRPGDDPGARRFIGIGDLTTEGGERIPDAVIAYESFGERSSDDDNIVLVLHGLSADSHAAGPPGPGHTAAGWWSSMIGPGLALDTDRWHVIVPNTLGGCQGSTGPASPAPDGEPWADRFPSLTVRDQSAAVTAFLDGLGIGSAASVIGLSMGGMHALELAVASPDRVRALGLVAAGAVTSADQIGSNSVQRLAVTSDPGFLGGRYYDAEPGEGPHRGLALARRMGLLSYRSAELFEQRFGRTRSAVDGRFAVQHHLDVQSARFPHRFDANSYLVMLDAKDSHDIGRGRGGLAAALGALDMPTLVVGFSSDRLFPFAEQQLIARLAPGTIGEAVRIDTPHGHDAFLIETEALTPHLGSLLALAGESSSTPALATGL